MRLKGTSNNKVTTAIIKFVGENENVKEISIKDIQNFTNNKYPKNEILLSLQLLCLSENPLLKLVYELNGIEIDGGAILEAERSGVLIHPKTGQVLPFEQNKENIFMYFTPID